MSPIIGTRGELVSRGSSRRRALRPAAAPALVAALVLLAAAPAVAQKQSCFPSCDPMDPLPADCCPTDLVDVPCNDYLACQANNRSQRAGCVDEFCMGHGALGQCDYAIKCSRACASSTINCSKALRSSLQTAGACSIGRGAARRACSRCFPEEPKVCSDQLADTTGSGCQKQCIRAQPWIQECYRKCSDRCTSDRCAIAVCRRVC